MSVMIKYECNDGTCKFHDNRNFCLFDACVAKNVPYCVSKALHDFKHNCRLCDTEYTIQVQDTPLTSSSLEYEICPACIDKLKLLIRRV